MMFCMRLITSVLLALSLAGGPAVAEEVIESSEYSTDELMSSTISPECLNWCLVGVCLWLRCSIYECTVEYSFRIRHNNPDFAVSVYPHPGEMPWKDWRDVFGEMQADTDDSLVSKLAGLKGEGGQVTPRENTSEESKHVRLKHADVVGHPMAAVIANMGSTIRLASNERGQSPGPGVSRGGDSESSETDGGAQTGEDHGYSNFYSDGDAGELYNNYGTWTGSDADMGQLMDAVGTYQEGDALMEQSEEYQEMFEEIEEMTSELEGESGEGSGGGGSGSGNYLCSTYVTAFTPYYLSAVDQVGWRYGVPDVLSAAAWVPTMRNVGRFPDNLWGGVYPRSGAINQIDDAKASAVLAQRAVDIVTREQQPHLYMHPDGAQSTEQLDWWQMASPEQDKSCKTFGKSTEFPWARSGDGGYSFNYWREYECCTEKKGIFIATVYITPVCLNDEQGQ